MFAGLRASAGASAPVDTKTPPTPPNDSPQTDTQPVSDSQSQPSLASDPQLAPGPSAEPSGVIQTTLAELGKVVWPTRPQLFSESVAVILMVGLSAAAIAAVDRFYGWTAIQVFR